MAEKNNESARKFFERNNSFNSSRHNDFMDLMRDRKTEMYVKFAKVMLIFQLPLSNELKGIISLLSTKFKNAGRFLTDESFRTENICSHNPEKTEDFHEYFKAQAERACQEGCNFIVIHQSLYYIEQMEFFYILSLKFQYVLLVIPPIVSHTVPFGIRTTYIRSQVKSLMEEGIRSASVEMRNFFQHYFCGWFLHDADSDALRNEASLYVQDCFENIAEFAKLYSQVCTIDDFRSYFNLLDKKQDLAYCVVKIFRNAKDVTDYFEQECVQQFYGKMSKLMISGFILSPHIIAARVKLSHLQKELWSLPNDVDENAHSDVVYISELRKQVNDLKAKFKEKKFSLISTKSNPTLVTKGDSIHEPTEMIPLNAKGRSCHIVLGKAPNASVKNIDYDVSFAVHRERIVLSKDPNAVEVVDVGRAVVRRIGKYWYIYLKQLLVIDGFFSTFCVPRQYDTTKENS